MDKLIFLNNFMNDYISYDIYGKKHGFELYHGYITNWYHGIKHGFNNYDSVNEKWFYGKIVNKKKQMQFSYRFIY